MLRLCRACLFPGCSYFLLWARSRCQATSGFSLVAWQLGGKQAGSNLYSLEHFPRGYKGRLRYKFTAGAPALGKAVVAFLFSEVLG